MILEVKDGAYAYPGKAPAFEHVNFRVGPGEVLAILGPNGAGKTTLLRAMMGMLRWQHGQSLLDGVDIRTISPRKLWSRMAYVPQGRGVFSSCTAFETVLLGRSSRLDPFSKPQRADLEKAEQVMASLGILHLRDCPCNAISGGEYQMVLIARALAAEPELLILDEPESNLDFKNQLIVLGAMSRLAQSGIACVFNTHYPEHALQRADKALILSGGTAVFGATSSVLTEQTIQRAFGVKAVIGEIETPEHIYRNVVPLHLAGTSKLEAAESPDARCIAAITLLVRDRSAAETINQLLHEYQELIIGRMGMPHRAHSLSIIHLTLDGQRSKIDELSHRLSLLQGLSVKTTFAPEEEEGGSSDDEPGTD